MDLPSSLPEFARAAVAGVPLVFVILGLVQYGKKLGLAGRAVPVTAMLIGLLLGGLYVVSQTRPPVGDWWVQLGYWFAVAIVGLAYGLLASGIWDVFKGVQFAALKKLFPDRGEA